MKTRGNVITKAVADIRARGAEVIDPLEIPNLKDLVVKAGGGETYEPEPALNEFLAQHPNSPVRTFRELADSPVVNARQRRNRREDASIERQKRSQCRNVVADPDGP